MTTQSADQILEQNAQTHIRRRSRRKRKESRDGLPSTAGYMLVAGVLSLVVFFLLWGVLSSAGDSIPWLSAALAASVIMLIAVAAREAFLRRTWKRYTQQLEKQLGNDPARALKPHAGSSKTSVRASATALREIKKRLSETETKGASPQEHLEAYRLSEQYLANTEEAIRSSSTSPDLRVALRAGQERVRELQKQHLLCWARGESTRLTQEAQRRVRVSDKIETAQQAIDVIKEALRVYPGEPELVASAAAVRDFIATVRVAHWVELAERAAFRGRYTRAIARYKDALFYLARAEMGEEARTEAKNRITHEIEELRSRLVVATTTAGASEKKGPSASSLAGESAGKVNQRQ